MKLINGILLSLLLIMLWMRWFGEGGARDYLQKQSQLEQQVAKNKELELRNEELKAEVDDLRSGNDLIEEKAREDLGFIGKDESFYLILEK